MKWIIKLFRRWCPQRLELDNEWARREFKRRQSYGARDFPCEHCTPLEVDGYKPCARHYGPRTRMF